jgi:hypothetical protein
LFILQWNYLKITNTELVSESWLLIKVYILSAVISFISCKRKHNLRKIQCTNNNYNGYYVLLNIVLFFRVFTKNAVTILNRISMDITGKSKDRSSTCPSVFSKRRGGIISHSAWTSGKKCSYILTRQYYVISQKSVIYILIVTRP